MGLKVAIDTTAVGAVGYDVLRVCTKHCSVYMDLLHILLMAGYGDVLY